MAFQTGSTPVRFAVCRNRVDALTILIEAKADVDQADQVPPEIKFSFFGRYLNFMSKKTIIKIKPFNK